MDVQRAFSRGSLTVSTRRHALSDQSVRVATVLGCWASVKGLIPEAEILKVLLNNSKCAKKVEGGFYVDEDAAAGADPEVINVT